MHFSSRACTSRTSLSLYGALALSITAFAMLCATPRPVHAAPDVCTVQANNPNSSIQQAVNSGCSQIRVTPGTYHENVVIPQGDTVTISSVGGAAKAIVDGSGNGSVFTNNGNLTLTGLTIQNGSANYGAGIDNESGTLTLTNSTVTNNRAFYSAGGILNNLGTATLNNSVVSNNSAVYGGGGIYSFFGTMTLNSSVVSNNSNSSNFSVGGGILKEGGTLTLNNSTVSINTTGQFGGGIFNGYDAITLTNSKVTNNSAGYTGGGIFSNPFTTMTLTNSVVSGNTPNDFTNWP